MVESLSNSEDSFSGRAMVNLLEKEGLKNHKWMHMS